MIKGSSSREVTANLRYFKLSVFFYVDNTNLLEHNTLRVYLMLHRIIFLRATHNSVHPFYPRRQKVFRHSAALVGDLEVIEQIRLG